MEGKDFWDAHVVVPNCFEWRPGPIFLRWATPYGAGLSQTYERVIVIHLDKRAVHRGGYQCPGIESTHCPRPFFAVFLTCLC